MLNKLEQQLKLAETARKLPDGLLDMLFVYAISPMPANTDQWATRLRHFQALAAR